MADLIATFNTKDYSKIEAMVVRNFAQTAFISTTKEDWVSGILESSKNLAPIAPDKILKSSEQSLVVKLKANTDLPVAIRIDLEDEQPFGILSARIGSPEDLNTSKLPRRFANWKELHDLAEDVRSTYKLPGLIVGYQNVGAKTKVSAAGLRNTQAQGLLLQSEDRMLVGSIGQTMTATLIARLVDLNKLSWDMTLGSVLPEVPMLDDYKKVTLEQLLSHQSGIPQEASVSLADVERLVSKIETPSKARMAYVKDVLTRAPNLVGVLSKRQANTDYVIAGVIAEKLIRQPYEHLMERYVFQPMKLTSMMIAPVGSQDQVGGDGQVIGHLLGDFGYTPFELRSEKSDWIMAPSGAGISSSLSDLIHFAGFHLRGISGDADILTAASYKKIHTAIDGSTEKLAGGWVIDASLEGQPCQWSAGTDGSFCAEITMWPKSGLIIAAAMNAGAARQPTPVRQAILAIRDHLTSAK